MGPIKKIVFKSKTETSVPNKKNFGGAHKFCFTNMKIVLQKCVPNKLLPFSDFGPMLFQILQSCRDREHDYKAVFKRRSKMRADSIQYKA